MPDVFDPLKRSEVMSKIRSKNTKSETIVFKFLTSRNVYFKRHYTRVKGKPDIALPRKKLAVFIDGDFWHGRTLEKLRDRRAAIEGDVWVAKIERNVERDKENRQALQASGWKVLIIWDSDIKRKSTRGETLEQIYDFLTKKGMM